MAMHFTVIPIAFELRFRDSLRQSGEGEGGGSAFTCVVVPIMFMDCNLAVISSMQATV